MPGLRAASMQAIFFTAPAARSGPARRTHGLLWLRLCDWSGRATRYRARRNAVLSAGLPSRPLGDISLPLGQPSILHHGVRVLAKQSQCSLKRAIAVRSRAHQLWFPTCADLSEQRRYMLSHMSATELLQEAADLTRRAEELQAQIDERRREFEDSIAADESKLREAREAAQQKITEAQRAMGSTRSRTGIRPSAMPTPSLQRRSRVDPDKVVTWLRHQGGERSAAEIREGVGIDVAGGTLSNWLSQWAKEGRIKKTGERRGTKYSAA
jgi:hypothetical protein